MDNILSFCHLFSTQTKGRHILMLQSKELICPLFPERGEGMTDIPGLE